MMSRRRVRPPSANSRTLSLLAQTRRRPEPERTAQQAFSSTWRRCCSTRSELPIVPVLLGDGARLFEHVANAEIELEQVRAIAAPGVTHVKYYVTTA